MNDKRRNKIREAIFLIDRAGQIVDQARDEETDAFDNLPESIQESERGEKIDEAIEALDYAADVLLDAKSSLQTAIG